MPNNLKLPDYVNSPNFVHISDKGSYYLIKMRAVRDREGNYRSLDNTLLSTNNTYHVELSKHEEETHY